MGADVCVVFCSCACVVQGPQRRRFKRVAMVRRALRALPCDSTSYFSLLSRDHSLGIFVRFFARSRSSSSLRRRRRHNRWRCCRRVCSPFALYLRAFDVCVTCVGFIFGWDSSGFLCVRGGVCMAWRVDGCLFTIYLCLLRANVFNRNAHGTPDALSDLV